MRASYDAQSRVTRVQSKRSEPTKPECSTYRVATGLGEGRATVRCQDRLAKIKGCHPERSEGSLCRYVKRREILPFAQDDNGRVPAATDHFFAVCKKKTAPTFRCRRNNPARLVGALPPAPR